MNRRARTCIVACLLLAAAVGAVPGSAAASPPQVDSVEYVGDGAVRDGREGVTLWQSASHRFEASVSTDENRSDADLCLVARATDGDASQELACRSDELAADGNTTVTFDVGSWPANLTGAQELRVELRSSSDDRVLASAALDATVIEKDGDLDDDGLTNAREVDVGTRLRVADTDNDSLSDGMEVQTYGTNPTNNDSDGDGLDDGAEVHEYQTDPTEPDTDGDGLADAREVKLGTNPNEKDSDGDGLDDAKEVNTYQTEPTDPDTDGDGLDDGAEVNEYETDPTKVDTDEDGLRDNLEVNTYGTNPNKVDTDGDGLDDGAEVHKYDTDPTDPDTDNDGLNDGKEVNRYGTNPNEADTDGDGLDDGAEVHKYDTDPTDPDTDGDGQSDLEEVQTTESGWFTLWTGSLAAVVAVLAVGVLAYRLDGVSVAALRRRLPVDDSSSNAPDAASGDAASTDRGPGDAAASDAAPADGASTGGGVDAVTEVDGGQGEHGGPAAASQASSGAQGAGRRADESTATGGEDERSGTGGEDANAGSDGERDDEGATESPPEDVPPEFLSDEERVQKLLADHDGRMRQSAVVEETDWSKAKTSRVLSAMADDGEVVKVQLGRGNVVARPGDLPPGVDPPDDE